MATGKLIKNFTVSCKDTYVNINKGISNFKLEQNLIGLPINILEDKNPYLKINKDDRYVDTAWIPRSDEDWSLELVRYIHVDGGTYKDGQYDSDTGRILFEEDVNGNFLFYIGDTIVTDTTKEIGLVYYMFTYEHENTTIRGYRNGVLFSEINTVVFDTLTKSVILGTVRNLNIISTIDCIKNAIYLLVVHEDTLLTDDQIRLQFIYAKRTYAILF